MDDTIRLTIPAQPRMVLVVRMTLAGYCSQCGADIDTLEDIRTLADEACYCLMHQPRVAARLRVSARMEGPTARIRFEAECLGEATGLPAHDTEIARGILSSLATEVWLEEKDGEINAIEAAVRLGPL